MFDDGALERVAREVCRLEQDRKEVARRIDKTGFGKVEEIVLDGVFAGIDGGLVAKSLHGADLVLARAVAAVFEFKKGRLSGVEYLPSHAPVPRTHCFLRVLENHDLVVWRSIKRLLEELSLAREVNEKIRPDFLLLDGSLVPQQADKPVAGSVLEREYGELLAAFSELYDSGGTIVGVVEDSRGKRFLDVLASSGEYTASEKKVLAQSVDSNILDYCLDVGEYTGVFDYASSVAKHPVLKDLPKSAKIRCFYLKTTRYDRPLRVEFLASEEKVHQIASSIYMLSAHHQEYGYPTVLTDADLQAKLSFRDMEDFYNSLFSRVGGLSSLAKKRRETRPF